MSGIFFRRPSGFNEEFRRELVASILSSEHFGPSVLGKEFVNTSGLSIVFRRDRSSIVASHFPFLGRLLEAAAFDTSNAFYINPLVLDCRSTVQEHVDCRYIPGSEVRILPTIVSVYYAEIDVAMVGGDLVFVNDDGEVSVTPDPNEFVHFVGSARHYVSKIANESRRVSVVIEQYNLSSRSLAEFPECHLVREDAGNSVPVRG
jgi:hypothetical protein